jgi:hypothetical protein
MGGEGGGEGIKKNIAETAIDEGQKVGPTYRYLKKFNLWK